MLFDLFEGIVSMKKTLLDENVVIEYMDASSRDHTIVVECIKIIRWHFGRPTISPITFIISLFLLGKFVKNKEWHKKQMQFTFTGLTRLM